MATITWQGPGGTVAHPTSGSWDTASNWSGGVEPGPSDTAILGPFGVFAVTLGDGSHSDVTTVGSLTVDTSEKLEIANMASLTVATAFTNDGFIIALSGGQFDLGSNATLTNNQNGVLSGAGSYEADANATLSLTGGAITTLEHARMSLNGAGSLIQSGSGVNFIPLEQSLTTIDLGGLQVNKRNYTTTNALALNGGTLAISNGAFSSGLITGSSVSVIEGDGGTLASSITTSGKVEGVSGGTITLAGANDVLSGVISGNVVFSGETVSIASDDTIGLAATIAGASVTFEKTIDVYITTLSSGSAILDAGVELTSSSTHFEGGAIEGSGIFLASGGSLLSATTIVGGKATLEVGGDLSSGADLILGDGSTSMAKLKIDAGGKYELAGASGIEIGDGSKLLIINQGQLDKVSGGESVVAPNTLNVGSIVADDALDLAGAVLGTGTIDVGLGATLQFDQFVATSQALTFMNANDTLCLSDAHDFHASLSGFAGNDAIDLLGFSAAGAKLHFIPDSGGGRLLVASGAMSADLVFQGQYTQASFHIATDNHGGSLLTVS